MVARDDWVIRLGFLMRLGRHKANIALAVLIDRLWRPN
jgi:hypothetical protein